MFEATYRYGLNRRWIIFSAILHIILFLLLIFGLPERKAPLLPPPPVIIDLVSISDKTRAPVISPKEIVTKKVADTAAPPPPPKPAVSKPKEVVEKTIEKKLPPKKQEPKPVPKEKAKPVVKPKKVVKKELKPEPVKKPVKKEVKKTSPKVEKPDPSKTAPPKKDFSSLIRKSIDDNKASPTKGAGQKATAAGRELSDVLTVSQMDAVRRHISRCWNIAAIQGARDLDKIVVKTQLVMNPDRTVKTFRVTGGSGQYSPFYNRMVETIERLFQRPDCKVLPLPPGQYSTWSNFQLTFSLKDQLGY